jgi:hypothetical protein
VADHLPESIPIPIRGITFRPKMGKLHGDGLGGREQEVPATTCGID